MFSISNFLIQYILNWRNRVNCEKNGPPDQYSLKKLVPWINIPLEILSIARTKIFVTAPLTILHNCCLHFKQLCKTVHFTTIMDNCHIR